MLSWVRRAWRLWRAKARLTAPYRSGSKHLFADYRLHFVDFPAASPEAPTEELPSYEGLAPLWDLYARQHQPDYAPFLDTLASLRGDSIRSVLDLACGTGLLAARLAAAGRQVVGVDLSPGMLAMAQVRCARHSEVQLLEGDFRNVDLGRVFDAVVCGSNSLNYLADPSELAAVFRVVEEHLRPGGVFLFDVFTDRGMRSLNGLYLHFQSGEGRFVLHFEYDRVRRVETSRALLSTGVEIHRRVPIDREDVVRALAGTKLEMVDYFSSDILPTWMRTGSICFYMLTRMTPEGSAPLAGG
jgi:SAM-dependent methyltransferase